jgi:hypothetical protein
MKSILAKFAPLVLSSLILFGCAGQQISNYTNEKPTLDLSEYFNGTIDAYGIFTDRSGVVKKRFTEFILANWQVIDGKKVGTLDDSIDYSDVTKQKMISK